ncbi:MAG TPA: DNA-formamidopyrimidine glycosylase family protein [Acidimicrobiia bacterium]|nr:DNA-formamidopyrimidine glycosylase family protein [Acidimicrobiia bacterium]
MPEILEVEAARKVLEAQALNREIVKVHAPDTWFMKRGTTAPALRHALVGNAFTAARRRGKQIVLDTRDPDVRVGVHLGMSGRVLVDDTEAGDPLVYASNRRVPKWHRFGVHFADGGDFMLRDPRRLGAVELDPDESRLGPDAMTLTYAQLDHALAQRNAPIKAVLMDQQRIAGLGNLLVDESLWRAGLDPARTVATIGPDERKVLHKAIRSALRTLDRRGGSHTGDMPRSLEAPCPRDGSLLHRAKVGGRTTYWCPVHQH